MKKYRTKTVVSGLLAAIFVVAAIASGGYACARKKSPPEPLPDVDWQLLNPASWDKTVYSMVPRPRVKTNAATLILGAIHFNFDPGEKVGLAGKYKWWGDFRAAMIDSDKEEDRAIVAKGVKIGELNRVVRASVRSEYNWVGVYEAPSPDPSTTFLNMKLPNYPDINKLCALLIARAYDKLEKGDKKGAGADMFAAMRVGHTMQKDVSLVGMMIGMAIENNAAKHMSDLYAKMGDDKAAAEWSAAWHGFEKHRENAKSAFKYIGRADHEKLKKIVENDGLPRSIRIEAMVGMVANQFLESPATIITGVPKKTKKYLLQYSFDDPEMRVIQLKIIEDVYIGPLSSFNKRSFLQKD